LADRVERTSGGLRVERLGRVERLPAASVRNLADGGVADRRVFVLGSDRFGRDVLSRLLHGARVSLGIGLLAVLVAITLGVAVGAAAATGGPWVDAVLMRAVDALLAFPWLFLLLALSALFRPGALLLVLLLGATAWMEVSRLVRAEVLGLRGRDYVLAARGIGQRPPVILLRHLLPGALPPVLVRGALLAGQVILVESALSFLGLGIQPPTASWGNMVAEGRDVLTAAWWLAAFPGAAIALTVIALNLLGDRLRDLLDPRSAV
ncbi:MAG TPA: ABC transporter permease, partial [Thermoanaerobaculia bacterium]|nr:ABC transporter permease [Thermoanaerobaculia bacterium]